MLRVNRFLFLETRLDKNETADNIIDAAGAGYYVDEGPTNTGTTSTPKSGRCEAIQG